MYPKIVLKPGREASVQAGHPWIFSGAVASAEAGVADGEPVTVVDAEGRFQGHGYHNSRSAIRVRLLTRDESQAIDAGFWAGRIARAVELRRRLFGPFPAAGAETDAFRLVNGEGDHLPGLVVDRYGPCLVVQFHTLGVEARRAEILAALEALPGVETIVERSDLSVRRKEGLAPIPPRTLRGVLPAGGLTVRENGLLFRARPLDGQKTGLYLDQRENRQATGRLAEGLRVLNCYAYSGGFSLAALRGGAVAVTSVESSAPALALLEENLSLNGLALDGPEGRAHTAVAGDVPAYLEQAAARGTRFDLLVLDPPAFVKHQSALSAGLNAYRRLNRLAMRLLPPGGILVSASCSSHVTPAHWESVLFEAARAERRGAQVLRESFHPPDHPIHLQCPEGRYLKCLFLRLWD